MAMSGPSVVRCWRISSCRWSTSIKTLQPRMRPNNKPTMAARRNSASFCRLASNTLASSTKAWTAAKQGGTARRQSFTTLPLACGAIVMRQSTAKTTVATSERLSGAIMVLVVELRRVLLRAALRLVVVDPQLGLLVGQQLGDARERRLGLLGAGVHRGHALVVPVVLEVHGVARQHQPAGLGQAQQQRLMAGRVARRGDDH